MHDNETGQGLGVLTTIVAVVALMILPLGCDPPPGPSSTGTKVSTSVESTSDSLYEAKLPNLDTGVVRPISDYAKRNGLLVMVVNTTCPYCGQAIDGFRDVITGLTRQGVGCLVVVADQADQSTVLGHYKNRLPTSIIVHRKSNTMDKSWGIDSVPTVLVFDKNGSETYRGAAEWDKVAQGVEKSLGLTPNSINFGSKGTSYG